MSKAQLARKVGYESPQNLTNKLARANGMRIDSLVKIMNAMGYDVVIKDRLNDSEVVLEVNK